MKNCVFCKIIAQKKTSGLIYEDSDLIAFHDINPTAATHFLVLPKQHIPTLSECMSEHTHLLGQLMMLAADLAREQGCGCKVREGRCMNGGYRINCNVGPDGGQEIYHLHVHVTSGVLGKNGDEKNTSRSII